VPGGGIQLSPSQVEALDTRWSSCWTPGDIAQRLAGIATSWCVAAGWALDLFRGRQVLAATYQTWLRDPATGNYLLDVFREPHDGETWVCRREATIRLPYSEIIHHTPDGIPYLAPELVLLFKAKHARPKDQADFDETVPHMTPAQRTALAGLLARVHPGHRWLANL
jgi:hypothetical protein